MSSIGKWPSGYRARYRDGSGRQHSKVFRRKVDAQRWLDAQTAAIVTGTHVDARDARTTVGEWADRWLRGYGSRRSGTIRQAEVHLARIKSAFGDRRLGDVRPSDVRSWHGALTAEGLAPSYVYALHARLAQLYADAVRDGLVPRSPCSRHTSPPAPRQRPYVATTEQVWALHDVVSSHARAAVLLGGFAGLRTAEACGLRVSDVDFMRGVISPEVQYPNRPLKTEASRQPVPIPQALSLALSAHVAEHATRGGWLLGNLWGEQLAPHELQRLFAAARSDVRGLPAGFRFHDLRHHYASLLIASGLDVKTVQARLRHASARTTLDTYGHLWPDRDESTREAVAAAFSLASSSRQHEA